jgi:PKD repeat protein
VIKNLPYFNLRYSIIYLFLFTYVKGTTCYKKGRQWKSVVYVSLIFLLITQQLVFAQKEGYVGIFGNGVGLDFNVSPPKVFLTTNSLDPFESEEGSATISDRNGNLLFYTNGVNAWDKNHRLMRGNNLLGFGTSTSTTQIIVVPLPKDPFRYYIFTPQYQGRDLKYSMVDMRLNNGLGDVVFGNVLLYTKSTEKVCVVKHSVDSALWLISHEYGSNIFRTYYIDENGIDPSFVESATGTVHALNSDGLNAQGYLKPSPDGTRLACAISGEIGKLELFKFDRSTGKVSFEMNLFQGPVDSGNYGVEFSPDGLKLYHSLIGAKILYQFDLSAGDENQIKNSSKILSTEVVGALQLGPDGKIYVINRLEERKYLSRINNPDALAFDCGFEKNALYLEGSDAKIGLPELNIPVIRPEIYFTNPCAKQATSFSLINTKTVSTVTWSFGDPSSIDNFSNHVQPSHTYNAAGNYTVSVTVTYTDNTTFTFDKVITIYGVSVNLGVDTTLCNGSPPLRLNATYNGELVSYQWSTGASAPVVEEGPGKYWVKVTNYLCTATDTIDIKYLSAPHVELKDTVLCSGQALNINFSDQNTSYLWNDGFHGGKRDISITGKYTLTASNLCGSFASKADVNVIPKLSVNLGNDTTICRNQKLALDVTTEAATYRWQDNSDKGSYIISGEGTYWVDLNNRCESVRDSIIVKYHTLSDYFIPNVITPNNDDLNERFVLDELLVGATLTIIDRWGKVVYVSENYHNEWPKEEMSTGVYYYSLVEACTERKIKGTIHVLR